MVTRYLCRMDGSCEVFYSDCCDLRRKGDARTSTGIEGTPKMTDERARLLAEELKHRFDATVVEMEQVSTGRFRFAVVSPRFVGVSPLGRQDLVWEAINDLTSRE